MKTWLMAISSMGAGAMKRALGRSARILRQAARAKGRLESIRTTALLESRWRRIAVTASIASSRVEANETSHSESSVCGRSNREEPLRSTSIGTRCPEAAW